MGGGSASPRTRTKGERPCKRRFRPEGPEEANEGGLAKLFPRGGRSPRKRGMVEGGGGREEDPNPAPGEKTSGERRRGRG